MESLVLRLKKKNHASTGWSRSGRTQLSSGRCEKFHFFKLIRWWLKHCAQIQPLYSWAFREEWLAWQEIQNLSRKAWEKKSGGFYWRKDTKRYEVDTTYLDDYYIDRAQLQGGTIDIAIYSNSDTWSCAMHVCTTRSTHYSCVWTRSSYSKRQELLKVVFQLNFSKNLSTLQEDFLLPWIDSKKRLDDHMCNRGFWQQKSKRRFYLDDL